MNLKPVFCKILAIVLLSAPAAAQEFTPRDPVFTFDSFLGTSNEVIRRSDGVFASKLITSLNSVLKARYQWRNPAGDQIFLEPSVSLSNFPIDRSANALKFGLFGEYRHRLERNEKLQFRAKVGVEHSNDVFDTRFNRLTLQSDLNIRHDKKNSELLRLRYRYRDQNEAETFDGFDQHELLASFGHSWRFGNDGPLELIALTGYGELRRAEASRFSYNELGLRLQLRYALENDWKVTGRFKAFARDYKSSFSSLYDFNRSDRRLEAEVELSKALKTGSVVYGAIGWQENNSNVPVRAFSGATIRLGYRIKF